MADGKNEKDSETDWDTAWRIELEKRETGKAVWRPEGREAVTDEQLRSARLNKAVDAASDTVTSWTRSWKFWVALLATVSLAAAVAGHMGDSSGGNYYV